MVHPCSILCDQYGCDLIALLIVQWCSNLTHAHTYELRGLSKHAWMIGVHGTLYTNQGKSNKHAGFTSSMLVHPWSIVWPVWMLSPCLVAFTIVYQPHLCTNRWIERDVNICIDGWTSLYITHHHKQEQEVYQFSSIHASPSLEYCVASMDMIPLSGWFYNCLSTSCMNT